jgi:murein DD-endopeptidase MepM/ murein hydrolase activator NlpD
MSSEDRRGRGKRWLWLAVMMVAGVAALVTFRSGSRPTIEMEPAMPGIGRRTPINVQIAEPTRGLARVKVEFMQADRVELLVEEEFETRPAWKFWGPATEHQQIEVEVGTETLDRLETGEATIRASAWPAGTWLRRPNAQVEELTLPVRLSPPAIMIRSQQHYVAQGGAGVIVYSVGPSAVEDGVRVGDWWFPGFALPGDADGSRFALFAVPFDLEDPNQVLLQATDDVGNTGSASFIDQFFPKAFKQDKIEVSDQFMERVVPAIMSNTPGAEDQGSLLDNYLWINRELRRRNTARLGELAAESRHEFLWNQTFLPMSNAQVMSSFADRRTYLYQGREVDQQDHLGFDLASVRQAEIPASNSGRVILARYFGIYGNAVAIDHGYGLMSLYGHLSSIAVEEGQAVERGQVIGRSGETGLAGGDHLHFTLLVGGQPVNPVEWWDAAWIRDRFAAKLGSALAFQP